MMIKLPFTPLSLALSATIAMASPFVAYAQSLESLLDDLIATNPAMKSAEQNTLAAQSAYEASKNVLYPSVQFTGAIGQNNLSNKSIRSINNNSKNSISAPVQSVELSAKQRLFTGYADSAIIAENELKIQSTHYNLTNIYQKTLYEGVSAYTNVALEQSILKSLLNSIKISEKILDNISQEDTAEIEIVIAEKDLYDQEALYSNQKHIMSRFIGQFNKTFGMQPNPEKMNYIPIDSSLLPDSLESALELLEQSAQVKSTFIQADIADIKITQSKAAYYPSIDLNASHRRNNDSIEANAARTGTTQSFTTQNKLELSLTWDLSASLLNKSTVAQSQAIAHARRLKAHETLLSARGELIQHWDSYQAYLLESEKLILMLERENRLNEIQLSSVESGGGKELDRLRTTLRRERTVQRHIRALKGLELSKAKILSLTNRFDTDNLASNQLSACGRACTVLGLS